MVTKQRQKSTELGMSTKVKTSSHSEIDKGTSSHVEQDSEIEPPTWAVCSDANISCVARGQKEGKRQKNMKTVLNMFSKHAIEKLADLIKERLLDQVCAPSSETFHLSVWKDEFDSGGYNPGSTDHMEKGNLNCH